MEPEHAGATSFKPRPWTNAIDKHAIIKKRKGVLYVETIVRLAARRGYSTDVFKREGERERDVRARTTDGYCRTQST